MGFTTATFTHDDWVIVQDKLDAGLALRDGAQFALANGAMGVRGGLEELSSGHASFFPDGYVRNPLHYHESFPGYAQATDTRLTGPALTAIRISFDGQAIDFGQATIRNGQRTLDFRTGELRRTTLWELADGREIEITSLRAVALSGTPIVATRITVKPIGFSALIRVDCPVSMDADKASASDINDPRISAVAAFRNAQEDQNDDLLEGFFSSPAGSLRSLLTFQCLVGADAPTHVSAQVDAGDALTLDRFVGAVILDKASDIAAQDAGRAMVRAAARDGLDAMIAANRAILDDFWASAAISIPDDAALESAIQFNLFHLFQSASRNDAHSVAAKGLTGEGYEGHYFWDTEAFMLPVLALTSPALARHILKFRIGTLDKAIAHARAIGHATGALYPWRTIGGEECSAHYPTGSAQYHINAAIAYGLEIYLAATSDESVLDEGGAELLYQTARLWIDTGHFSTRRGGAFVIHGVTGPDEYSALVDNDFYTNAMAKRHLRFAAQVAQKRGDLTAEEIAIWDRAATHMWLPLDPATGVHPQDDGFMDKPLFESTGAEGGHGPLLVKVHPMVLFRHRLCKQGDVVQAHAIGATSASMGQIQQDIAYYEPLTTHDLTLSGTAFAISAAKSGLIEQALHFHQDTALVDVEDRHNNTSHGCHLAAMAGSWLALAMGWGGMSIVDGQLSLAPICPDGWTQYRFRFTWRESIVEAVIEPQHSLYTLIAGPVPKFTDRGRPVEFVDGTASLRAPSIDAVIFDLDGVITDTAELHYAAWKRLCDEEGIAFDRQVNEALKGVDRAESLTRIAQAAGITIPDDKFAEYLVRKNGFYRDSLSSLSPADIYPGVERLLVDCRNARLKIGLASASRNAPEIIARLGIAGSFDFIADSAAFPRGKPAPDIFLGTAAALGVEPARCVGVEDFIAGITAINAAGMTSIGVGDAATLSEAKHIVAATGDIRLCTLNQVINSSQQ